MSYNPPPSDPAWKEYESAAAWCAARGYKGVEGDPLPDLMSTRCRWIIDADPEAFEARVKDYAYAGARDAYEGLAGDELARRRQPPVGT